MKKILLGLLLFLPVFLLTAQQMNNSGEFAIEIWQVNRQQAAVITNYKGASAHIVIPKQINGYPVAGIGNNAFRGRRIESVQFPQTLVFIGEYAFYDNRLYDVKLPSNVTTIGVGAFDNNAPSNNPPSSASATPPAPATYTRTVTIEPAHSNSTVYIPPKTAVPQSVNIIVVPGYNPVDSARQPVSPRVTTTVRDYESAPAPAYSYSPPPPQQTAAPQNMPYQLVPGDENTGIKNNNKQLFQLVPEGASEIERVIYETPETNMLLQQEEIQQLWQLPRRR
jgi:hypothetical protein